MCSLGDCDLFTEEYGSSLKASYAKAMPIHSQFGGYRGDYILVWTKECAIYWGMEINGITGIACFLTDEAAAQQALADLRWPDGNIVCPHDGCEGGKKVYEVAYSRKAKDGSEIVSVRRQWKCGACRKKFSVTTGSIFEGAHVPVGKWIYAIFLMCSSKKGVSANQLSRDLDITYKSAWFMCHRVREAMLQEPLAGMLGTGPDAIVELDETYVGGKKKNNRHKNRTAAAGRKTAVMTLIDREGDVKTVKVPNVRKGTLQALARPIVDQSATIITDSHLSYGGYQSTLQATTRLTTARRSFAA